MLSLQCQLHHYLLNGECCLLTTIFFISELSVLGSDTVWFVNFYSPYCSHCHTLAPTVSTVLQKSFPFPYLILKTFSFISGIMILILQNWIAMKLLTVTRFDQTTFSSQRRSSRCHICILVLDILKWFFYSVSYMMVLVNVRETVKCIVNSRNGCFVPNLFRPPSSVRRLFQTQKS